MKAFTSSSYFLWFSFVPLRISIVSFVLTELWVIGCRIGDPGLCYSRTHRELKKGEQMRKLHCIVAGLLVALGALALHADEVEPPKVHKQGGSIYVSGGVDEPRRKAMVKVASKYPIQLIFEVQGKVDGVSGVKVTLRDIKGDAILEAVSEGPYFYINPPAGGRYTIEAEFDGEKQSMTKDLVGRRYLILDFKFAAG